MNGKFDKSLEGILKKIYAKGKHPIVMFNCVTGEPIDSKEAWDRMVAQKRPKAK